MKLPSLRTKVSILLILAAAAAAVYYWMQTRPSDPGPGFVHSNGRIEATEIDIATQTAGRVEQIDVQEGDLVAAGQTLARMRTHTLRAQRNEADARLQQAIAATSTAAAQVSVRQSEGQAAMATLNQRRSEADAASRRLKRSESLLVDGASSEQEVDDDRAHLAESVAAVAAAKAQVAAAKAAVTAASTQVAGARSTVAAGQATVARIDADIDDSSLVAPRSGRVQYRIAQPGEVLGAGGKVLNLIDLSDVFMTFFVPEPVAGRLGMGSEVHIVLDAAPTLVIPAAVTFVASEAQFTPKTVETASERQKLMFRVKARIDASLLKRFPRQIKSGLPGVAWVRLDSRLPWPEELTVKDID